jgi:hypothetical protein
VASETQGEGGATDRGTGGTEVSVAVTPDGQARPCIPVQPVNYHAAAFVYNEALSRANLPSIALCTSTEHTDFDHTINAIALESTTDFLYTRDAPAVRNLISSSLRGCACTSKAALYRQ